MIIYKKDNSVRLQVHQSDDSEMIQEISGEEYVLFKFESNVFTTFEVGDYITVYGQTFTLKKVVAPIEKSGTNRFDYTLKFKSTRDDLCEVNFQLFDNTTISIVPAYNPSTTYSQGDVVSYHTLHWKYISSTPTSGNAPAENEYWAIKSTITSYVPPYNSATTYTYGDTVDYNHNYFMHIGSVDTVGVAPVEGEHWTVVKTAPMWDFSTILTPTRYAQLIVDNMNRARPNQTWTVGYCIPAEPKESTFSNVKCLDAASSIAELFETEFWVDGYSVNFGKRSNATSITMQFGKGGGFTKVIRNEVTESRKVTRLIALGGEANLLGTYRNGSKRLMLPNRYYLDADNIDLSSPLEDTQTWDDIMPTMQHATEDYDPSKTYYAGNQVLYNGYSWDCIATATGVTPTEGAYWKYSEGTVTTTVSQYKLIDKNLTFDPLDMQYRMTDGTVPKVKFFTGNLAGYEFPITGYNNITKQITIEQISDGTNSLLPTASYGFKVGDRFGFVDLYMPASYVAKAEQRLLAKAQEFLEKYSKDQISYSGDVDEIWATNGNIELHIGDVIHFVDADFNISLDYRIIKVTRNLTRQYKYSIELSTLPYIPSKITSITNKVTQNDTYIEYNGLNTKMSKSKTFLGAREAIDMAFDPSGSYFTDKIKPLIVETSALLVGTEQQQYQVTDLSFKTYASNPNLIEWLAGTLTDSSVEESERTWNIVSGNFTATDDNQTYYCYIRCVRTSGSTSAIVLFDTVQHLTEEGNDYYYFLMGSLSSVKNGMRQLYTSKGFTFINGDTIVTGRIQSENGNVDIDLANEELHFGDLESYLDWRNSQLKIKGTLTVSPSGIEFPTPCYRGNYISTDTYYKGDTVLYNGSTWIYVNATPASGVTPVEGAYWNLYSKKGDTGATGPQGVAGPAGADGVTYYTWIRYADTSVGGGISNDPTGKSYIGFAYNKTTATESNTPSDYTWSLIKGEKGDTGVQGATGADGITYYTWIKYSDNSDGTGLYDTPTSNTQYIGIAVNKTTATESTVKTDYTWSKFKGDTGETGVGISFTTITYQASSSGTVIPTGTWLSTIPYISAGQYLWTRTIISYTNSTSSTSYSVGMMGEKGATGADGTDGTNGVGIASTNVAYQASSSGTVAPTGTWASSIPSVSPSQYLWTRTIWTYTDSTTATGYSVGMMGATGATGATGQTGNFFEHRYAVNGSPTVAPSIVVTDTIPSGWTTTLPTQGVLEYTWMTTSQKTSIGALVSNWSTPQRITGLQGAAGDRGANGPAQSYWGIWDSGKSYVGTDIIVNVVKYSGVYYISRVDAGVIPAGALPTNTTYWNVYGTTFESIATGLLLAENAWIGNLIVSRLGTSANPYAGRFANVGSGIGIFRNLNDESSIDNAIIGMGKDISIAQQSGERKPAFVVRDRQWRGTYSSIAIYYKDDRVYYSSHLGAATWSSSASYNIGTYVTYNSTVWVCTTNNIGYTPYIGSPYWSADGATYIFTKDWLETDTPYAGYLPTNDSYWQYLGSGNLGGGSYSELGSEGMFSNGSNIRGFAPETGLQANVSAAYLLQKRNSNSNGVSAAVLGMDQTDETDGISKSYGGYFNSAYIGRVVHNIRNVSASGNILKSDYRIHSYASSAITLTLPIADNSMIGQDIFVRKLGAGNVTVVSVGSQSLWLGSSITSTVVDYDALTLFTWDGNYWVVNEMNN